MDPGLLVNQDKRTVFLSHAGEDTEKAKELAGIMRRAGLEVWLDIEQLKPADRWMERCEQGVAQANAFAVYVGRSGVRGFVDYETRTAIVRDAEAAKRGQPRFPLFAILGPDSKPEDLPAFLKLHQYLDLRHETRDAEAMKQFVGAVLAAGPRECPYLDSNEAPFLGLDPFSADRAALFFGRDREISQLLERLARDAFVAVVGDSGSGKSSLVRAGLIPALRRGRYVENGRWVSGWRCLVMEPGTDPFESLATASSELLADGEPVEFGPTVQRVFHQCLKEGSTGLIRSTALLRADGWVRSDEHILIVIDQFEELFNESLPEHRQRFVDTILSASRDRAKLHVLVTLRSDFYPRCWDYRDLPQRIADNQVNVVQMHGTQLKEVIIKPAAMAGLTVADGLVEDLLKDLGEGSGRLPLLAFALLELWKRRRNGELTHEAYNDIGRVEGALRNYAEHEFGRLHPVPAKLEQQQKLAELVFLTLTRAGRDSSEDTKRPRGRRELAVALAAR